MIFYNGELVEWKNATKDDGFAYDVRTTITNLHHEYFGKDKKGFCQLRYPNGIRVKNKTGKYEPKKQFFLDLVSFDGRVRWSDSLPRNGKFRHKNGNHYKIQDPYLFYEKDIELIYFLKTYCPQVKSKKVYFEDFEEVAKKEAKENIADIDIKYAIYSNKSPLAKDNGLLREVADIFGVEEVNKLGTYELKNALFARIKDGESAKSKYVNMSRFDELTDSESKLKAASIVKKAINGGSLKFKKTDKSWYTHMDGEYVESLLTLKPTELNDTRGVLLDKVLTDKAFKGKIYAELGIAPDTRKELEELGYHNIVRICKNEGIDVDKGAKQKEVVDKYCEKKQIS